MAECPSFTMPPKANITRQVATRSEQITLEVIDPEDWDTFTTKQQLERIPAEQEAGKYAIGKVELTKDVRNKLPRR